MFNWHILCDTIFGGFSILLLLAFSFLVFLITESVRRKVYSFPFILNLSWLGKLGERNLSFNDIVFALVLLCSCLVSTWTTWPQEEWVILLLLITYIYWPRKESRFVDNKVRNGMRKRNVSQSDMKHAKTKQRLDFLINSKDSNNFKETDIRNLWKGSSLGWGESFISLI